MSSSENFDEDYMSEHISIDTEERQKRSYKLKTTQKPKYSNVEGMWTQEESIKYALFIDYNTPIFNSKEKRKTLKIFVALAAFLGTRTPRQCRSHFQKLMNRFKKLNKIKAYYEQLIGPLAYQRRLDEVTAQLKQNQMLLRAKKMANVEVQTDPKEITLTDLSNIQIEKLLFLLQQRFEQKLPAVSKIQTRIMPVQVLTEDISPCLMEIQKQ